MKKAKILISILIPLLLVCSIPKVYEQFIKDNVKIVSTQSFKEEASDIATNKEKTYRVQKYTILDSSDINKLENVKLSIASINDITIKPGEEFSFNNVVGERTIEKGYKESKVIYKRPNGESYEGLGIGGGICQVSSTLYMTCKELNLEILERRPHTSRVTYCSVEDEAMINWGTSDFRFKNNLNEDITIKLYLSPVQGKEPEQRVICEIW